MTSAASYRVGDRGRDPDRRRRAGNGCRNDGGTRVEDDRRLLAERLQRERHAHGRADGVAVGPLVRGDEEALAAMNAATWRAATVQAHPASRPRAGDWSAGSASWPRHRHLHSWPPGRRGGRIDQIVELGMLVALGVQVLEDSLDAVLRRHRLVVLELDLGRAAQRQALAEEVPQVRHRAVERLGACSCAPCRRPARSSRRGRARDRP